MELEAMGCTVYATSVDTLEQACEVVGSAQLTSPVVYGVTKVGLAVAALALLISLAVDYGFVAMA